MRAVYIIGEGQTEEEFVNEILRPYLYDFGIHDVRCILLREDEENKLPQMKPLFFLYVWLNLTRILIVFKENLVKHIRKITIQTGRLFFSSSLNTSKVQKGGDLKFHRYRENVIRLLKQESDILVTSLIDFYKRHSDFPKYRKAQEIINKEERVKFLEEAISERINNQRLIPYIQLHEFEGLLFSDIRGFDNDFIEISPENKSQLVEIIDTYPNPELLNDGNDTAPSKRLIKLIPDYQKALHGPIIADIVSIQIIRKKCLRFNAWLDKIIKKMNTA